MSTPPVGLKPRAKAALKSSFVRVQRLRRRGRAWSWRVLPASLHRPHDVVSSFDVHEYQRCLVADLSTVLDAAGVEHLILDQRTLSRPQVAIDRADYAKARRALAGNPISRNWWGSSMLIGRIGRPHPMRRSGLHLPGAAGLLLSRNLVTSSGVQLTDSETGVVLAFWDREESERPATGGGSHEAGSILARANNGVLDYAGPKLWAQIQANGHRLPHHPPHLMLLQEPVDLVYSWVDGADPAWLRRKATALGEDVVAEASIDAAIPARFESRDELLYSLRSVQMYANWVRRIWIVTDQQVPAWLQQDDRLRVVDHREIFSDPGALPVYNSHAIESQLHHIEGLAEHYLYLNDDMLFAGLVQPEDFFHGNGISKFFTSPALLDIDDHDPNDLAVAAAGKNNRDLVESRFGRTITNKLRHTPQPQVRSVIESFEAEYPDLFDQVMRSRLRHSSNYALPSSLSQYYAFGRGRAVTGRIRYGYVDLAAASAETTLELWLRRRNMQTFCVNDSGEEDPVLRAARERALQDFFEEHFPVPSRWEVTKSGQ